MPVTWCYEVNENDQSKRYCSTGFPVGCYVDSQGQQKDACVIRVCEIKIIHCFFINS